MAEETLDKFIGVLIENKDKLCSEKGEWVDNSGHTSLMQQMEEQQ